MKGASKNDIGKYIKYFRTVVNVVKTERGWVWFQWIPHVHALFAYQFMRYKCNECSFLYVPRPVPATPVPCVTEPMTAPVPVAPEPNAPEPTVPVSIPERTESIYFKLRNKLKLNMPSMPTSIATQAAIKVVPKLVPPKLAPPKLMMLKKVSAVSLARFAFCTVTYEAW